MDTKIEPNGNTVADKKLVRDGVDCSWFTPSNSGYAATATDSSDDFELTEEMFEAFLWKVTGEPKK